MNYEIVMFLSVLRVDKKERQVFTLENCLSLSNLVVVILAEILFV